MNDFADFALFVQFYLFAAVDPISGLKWTPKWTPNTQRNDKLSLSETKLFWCSIPSPAMAMCFGAHDLDYLPTLT